MKVYVIFERHYGGEVLGVYTTEELAIEARSHHPGSLYEESEVDVLPVHPPDCYFWYVAIGVATGNIRIMGQLSSFPPQEEETRSYSDVFEVRLWAKSKIKAEKLALEKYKFWKLAQNAPHDHDHLTKEENDAIFGTK
jgi:hypothetical protein